MKKPALRHVLAAGLVLGAALSAQAQSVQKARSTIVHAKVNYLTFLPKSYSANGRPVPLIIFLHGSGESGSDLNKVKMWGPPAIAEKDPAFPFMVVSPQ